MKTVDCEKIWPHGMKAGALPKISIMSLTLKIDFEKQTKSQGVIDLLSNGLQDDPEKDVLLPSIKECLAKMAKGNKLPYMAANYLLIKVLKALALEDGNVADEISLANLPDSQLDEPSQGGLDDTILGSTEGASGSGTGISTGTGYNPASNTVKTNQSKKKEICRYYARGRCTKKGECRFEHPSICKIFRQFGSKANDPKGCEENCKSFHPNACRSSVRDKTCSWTECRFFHLKGTKTVNRDQNGSASQNWRTNGQVKQQNRPGQKAENTRQKPGSKNRSAGLDQKIKKKKSQNTDWNPGKNTSPSVTQKEKNQLGQTLEAIMKRLDAMESRPVYYAHPGVQSHPPTQVQPLLSPAVPQLGTQTQYQWGSPLPWTQTATQ